MKKFTILLLFLIPFIIFSQEYPEYPKMVIQGGDTLVMITIPQVDSINITYITLDEYREKNDSLHSAVDSMRIIIGKDDELMKVLEERIAIKDTIIEKKDEIIEIQDIEMEKKDKKIRRLRIIKIGLVVLCVIFAVT